MKKFSSYKKMLFQATPNEVVAHLKSYKVGDEPITIIETDFRTAGISWVHYVVENISFLNCQFNFEDISLLQPRGAVVLNAPKNLPYNPFEEELYTWQKLMKGYTVDADNSYDIAIYKHFVKNKYAPPASEALWQRLHDLQMDELIRSYLQMDEYGVAKPKCVGIMGGHSTLRTDIYYEKVAILARYLTQSGYMVVSGGGPGLMEAANLGAYFADYGEDVLRQVIRLLRQAPHYSDKNFHTVAFEVIEKYPKGSTSLAIPTWFYGHEPSNLFASHIAKYFSNSIREDTLLAIALNGIIFAPGSAGTTQEIFQDAAQNHYGTLNFYSPMIFFGKQRYEIDTFIYPLMKQLSYGRAYHDFLHVTDEPHDVVAFIEKHPPLSVDRF